MQSTPERSCGGCTACCYTHSVDMDGVTTGFYSLCTHCTAGVGCAIYTKRPRSCQVYKCLWRSEDLPEMLRPDKSGIILDVWPYEDLGANFLIVWEVTPNSLERPWVKTFVQQLFETKNYILWKVGADKDVLSFPDSISQEVRDFITKQFSDQYRTRTEQPA